MHLKGLYFMDFSVGRELLSIVLAVAPSMFIIHTPDVFASVELFSVIIVAVLEIHQKTNLSLPAVCFTFGNIAVANIVVVHEMHPTH